MTSTELGQLQAFVVATLFLFDSNLQVSHLWRVVAQHIARSNITAVYATTFTDRAARGCETLDTD
jgi:hypothetical protein